MELINRYLQAIKVWLPKEQQDVVAELSEDIRSEVEEKEAALGRALSETELEAVLKERGNPLLVAERYLPPRHLVGPVLFPIYRLLLRSVLLYYAVPWILVWLCFVLFVPSYRADHPGLALLGTLRGLWLTLLHLFAGLTIAFALVDKYGLESLLTRDWSPHKLPVARDEARISRFSSITQMLWNAFLALWWLGLIGLPNIPDVHVTLAPGMGGYFYWPILLLLLASLAMAAVNTIAPIWTRRRAAFYLILDSFGAILGCLLLAFGLVAGKFLVIAARGAGPSGLATLSSWVNFACSVTLAFITISFVVRSFQDLRRLHSQGSFRNWMTDLLGGH